MGQKYSKHLPDFDVRKTQLLTPFGIGALMDVNNQSIIIADSEYWDEEGITDVVSDVRLEKSLKSSGFISPPIPSNNDYIQSYEMIVGKRFPNWYFAPTSRRLMPFYRWEQEILDLKKDALKNIFYRTPFTMENKRKEELSPVRILCACDHGHLQEFPWSEWAHQGVEISREEAEKHTLILSSMGNSTSIGELIVRCKDCGTQGKSLNGIFNKESLPNRLKKIGVKCKGNYIWKRNDNSGENCERSLQVLLRSQSNIYFPIIRSSVNIPSESTHLLSRIKCNDQFERIRKCLDKKDGEDKYAEFKSSTRIQMYLEDLSEELRVKLDIIIKELDGYFFPENVIQDEETIMEYRREEYQQLIGEIKVSDQPNVNFNIRIVEQEKFKNYRFSKLISKITLVNSLEVVSALTGYTRINTFDNESMLSGEINTEEANDVKFVSLRRNDNRYVAIKTKGEGVFIELSLKEVNYWFERIKESDIFHKIKSRKQHIRFEDEEKYVNPKYYLLHTLSHLLIKELTNTSGYSSSSLKERLYFSDAIGSEMMGVLIYTSSSDAGGTLGGLAKQGLPQNLFSILYQAIEKAKWCSFDPVCIDSPGQGRNSLNIAACHACSLISETSCENMNVFLDRNLIIGSLDHPEYGFFDY